MHTNINQLQWMMSRLRVIKVKSARTSLRELCRRANLPLRTSIQLPAEHEADPLPVVPIAPATPTKDELIEHITAILARAGMRVHFGQSHHRITVRCARLIQWTFHNKYSCEIAPVDDAVFEHLNQLLHFDYDMVHAYCDHLVNMMKLAYQTVKNYLVDIKSCFSWLTLHAPMSLRQPMNQTTGIDKVAAIVHAKATKMQRRIKSTDKTMDEKVRLAKLPAGGLRSLVAALMKELPWLRSMKNKSKIEKKAYYRYIGGLISSMYLLSPQGRPGGINGLPLDGGFELARDLVTFADAFKTQHLYGFQPVTLSEIARELLVIYLEHLRPQVTHCHPSCGSEPLWLDFDGNADLGIGKRVTSFFKRTLALHINVTGIRDLIETATKQKELEGKITPTERTAIMNISGHNSNTVEQHYILQNRRADVWNSRSTFAILTAPDDFRQDDENREPKGVQLPLSNLQQQQVLQQQLLHLQQQYQQEQRAADNPQSEHSMHPVETAHVVPVGPYQQAMQRLRQPAAPADWGREHPDYNTERVRAKWTDQEKQYVGAWVTDFRLQCPDATTAVACCLKHIYKDPLALPIFHKYHVLDSARLRNGYRSYLDDVARKNSPQSEFSAAKRKRILEDE